MRKVKFVTYGFFGGKNSSAPGPIKEGWFHGFFQEGNNESGVEPVAIVETLTGECISVGVRQTKFELQPNDTVQEKNKFCKHYIIYNSGCKTEFGKCNCDGKL